MRFSFVFSHIFEYWTFFPYSTNLTKKFNLVILKAKYQNVQSQRQIKRKDWVKIRFLCWEIKEYLYSVAITRWTGGISGNFSWGLGSWYRGFCHGSNPWNRWGCGLSFNRFLFLDCFYVETYPEILSPA